MDFSKRLGQVNENSIFRMDGYYVWCGSVTRAENGKYYLFFSFWEKSATFREGWVTVSKIGYATSDNLYGGYEYKGIALDSGKTWDSGSVHNPTVIRHGGKYYMYYMGNYGDGTYWSHRNNQRIGVAVADTPDGPWTRYDTPALDVSRDSFDSLMVSNPSVTEGKDGKFYMIYKAVKDNGIYPRGGAVVCGIATSDTPLGPFKKYGKPILVNPENDWSVEDAFIWQENGKFYVIAKDFQGYFTKSDKGDMALFCSDDGFEWKLSDTPLAAKRELHYDTHTVSLNKMERPQIYIENGIPKALSCACMPTEKAEETYNVIIPMK